MAIMTQSGRVVKRPAKMTFSPARRAKAPAPWSAWARGAYTLTDKARQETASMAFESPWSGPRFTGGDDALYEGERHRVIGPGHHTGDARRWVYAIDGPAGTVSGVPEGELTPVDDLAAGPGAEKQGWMPDGFYDLPVGTEFIVGQTLACCPVETLLGRRVCANWFLPGDLNPYPIRVKQGQTGGAK